MHACALECATRTRAQARLKAIGAAVAGAQRAISPWPELEMLQAVAHAIARAIELALKLEARLIERM